MKIRTDFVTNSSSSSFVCIQFKSKKLKELLQKYDVQYWESDSKWDVIYADDASSAGFGPLNDIESLLDWFVEDFMNLYAGAKGDGLLNEYRRGRELYYHDVKKASYQVETMYYGEFGDDEESHSFEYTKPKERKKQAPPVPKNLRSTVIDDLTLARKNRDNLATVFSKYKEYFLKGEPTETTEECWWWMLYDAEVCLDEEGFLYYSPIEKEFGSYHEEIEAFLKTPLEELELSEIPLCWLKVFRGEEHLANMRAGDTVRLYREPDQPNDPNAVFATDMDGRYLGYIPGDKAAYIAPFLNNRMLCWRGTFIGEVSFFYGGLRPGIAIELKSEEEMDTDIGFFAVENGSPGLTLEEADEIHIKLEDMTLELLERYRDKKMPSTLATLKKHNPDLPLNQLKQWLEWLNEGTVDSYIKDKLHAGK